MVERAAVKFQDQPGSVFGRYAPWEIPLEWWRTKHSRYVFLIHGFRVDQLGAEHSYERFRGLLEKELGGSALTDLVYLEWPAQASTLPRYKEALEAADSVAKYLSKYLDAVNADGSAAEIVLVAHSLGCLLVLNALQNRPKRADPVRRHISVVLMAAAAPVALVAGLGQLRDVFAELKHISVLFSPNDRTLLTWFPLGQSLWRRQTGLWQEAIGLRGLPIDAWDDSWQMCGFDHKDYWTAAEVAKHVVAVMAEESAPRELRRRELSAREVCRNLGPRARVDAALRFLARWQ